MNSKEGTGAPSSGLSSPTFHVDRATLTELANGPAKMGKIPASDLTYSEVQVLMTLIALQDMYAAVNLPRDYEIKILEECFE